MSNKRVADDEQQQASKVGQRPANGADTEDTPDFEDEFEDEYESEDEILEAGVDGRPDADREAEQAKGRLTVYRFPQIDRSNVRRRNGHSFQPADLYTRSIHSTDRHVLDP